MTENSRKLNCDDAIRLLFEFLDNELDRHDHAAVEAHLHDCRACFSRMEFDKRLRGLIKGEAATTAPTTLRERIKKLTEQF